LNKIKGYTKHIIAGCKRYYNTSVADTKFEKDKVFHVQKRIHTHTDRLNEQEVNLRILYDQKGKIFI